MTIREYIEQHPGATDQEVLDALNGTTYAPVPLADIEVWTIVGDRRARMRAASEDANLPTELRVGLKDLFEALASPRLQNLDLTDEGIRQRWLSGAAGLEQAGVLTPEESAELQAMGRTVTAYVEADVQAVRDNIAREAARDELKNKLASLTSWVLTFVDDAGSEPTADQIKSRWEA